MVHRVEDLRNASIKETGTHVEMRSDGDGARAAVMSESREDPGFRRVKELSGNG